MGEINMSNTLVSFRPAAFIGYPFVPDVVNITEEYRVSKPQSGTLNSSL